MSLTSCSYLSSPRRLFVGQLPRSFTDADLRKLFSDYGEILEANIITDKLSGISKGCGFVTYAQECSVTVAQENLHGRRILEGMSYPMYVKPADVGGITGKKLFVGMIGKLTTKDDLIRIFSKFGEIEDVTLLKTPDGMPKSCAFVKFYNREDANRAISETNGKFILKGSHAPIVVKIAENEQEKVLKKFQSAVWSITKLVENLNVEDKKTENKSQDISNQNGIVVPKVQDNNANYLYQHNHIKTRDVRDITKELLKRLKIQPDNKIERRYGMNTL